MLCGRRVLDNEKVLATVSEREHAPFVCIGCGVELVLKKGRIKVHHFAHKPPHSCHRSEGESIEHMSCKLEIYNELLKRNNVTNVQLEHNLGTAVADVYAVIDGVPVAIEIQRSKLSVNEIIRRTKEYTRLKVNVIWIALYSNRLTKDKFSPNAWEKWCHALYYGKVYYWMQGLKLAPYHFGEYKVYVESSSYYDEYGQEVNHGGYEKFSKRWKTPHAGPIIDIANSFDSSFRKGWSGGTVVIPDCRLYIDRKKPWWK